MGMRLHVLQSVVWMALCLGQPEALGCTAETTGDGSEQGFGPSGDFLLAAEPPPSLETGVPNGSL
jgi:hypothetical protein